MNTEDQSQPEALPSGPYRITAECQPTFPCWLWAPPRSCNNNFGWWWRCCSRDVYALDRLDEDAATYYHPDQPEAPTVRPDAPPSLASSESLSATPKRNCATSNPPAVSGEDSRQTSAPSPEAQPWMVAAAKAFNAAISLEISGDGEHLTDAIGAAIIARHAPRPTRITLTSVKLGGVSHEVEMTWMEESGELPVIAPPAPATGEGLREAVEKLFTKLGEELWIEGYDDNSDIQSQLSFISEKVTPFLTDRQSGEVEAERRMRRTMESAHGEILTECVRLRAEITRLKKLLEEKAT